MLQRSIRLDGHDVPYLYGTDCSDEIAEALAEHLATADAAVLVLDHNAVPHAEHLVERLGAALPLTIFPVAAGEQRKTLALVEELVEHAIANGLTRNSAVLAMGGGMVGNVAGLAAALLFRGTRLVHLPTTPIAAFDSVLSVKQAVNLRGGKNLCGTYHPPSLIACDLGWLTTVPSSQLLTGMAEMVKNVLAVAPEREAELVDALDVIPVDPAGALVTLLEIGRSAKEGFLRHDPHERKEALIFEYGHTMGHALEFASHGAMGHGEAVAWGMLVAAEVSHSLGHLSSRDVDRHHRLLAPLRLPDLRTRLAGMDRLELRQVLSRDNKRGYVRCAPGEVPMVLLESLGNELVGPSGHPLVSVPVDDVLAAVDVVAGVDDRSYATVLSPAQPRSTLAKQWN